VLLVGGVKPPQRTEFLGLFRRNSPCFIETVRNARGRGVIEFRRPLYSRPDAFAGGLLACDTTLLSSTAGGVENLRRFWIHIIQRPEKH
jgi:hypothetical protein